MNKVISEAKAHAVGSAKKASFWKTLTVILFLFSIVLIIKTFWLDQKPFSDYQNIIPSQTQAVFFIKISELGQLVPSVIPGLEQNSDFYKWLKQKISQFMADSDVDVQKELLPTLEEETAFLVFPENGSNKLVWAAIGQINLNQTVASQKVISKLEEGLKKNFGINQLFYRQVKINTVYAFNKIDKPYYYSQVDNYLIVGNDLGVLEKIIDEIIGNGNFIGNFR